MVSSLTGWKLKWINKKKKKERGNSIWRLGRHFQLRKHRCSHIYTFNNPLVVALWVSSNWLLNKCSYEIFDDKEIISASTVDALEVRDDKFSKHFKKSSETVLPKAEPQYDQTGTTMNRKPQTSLWFHLIKKTKKKVLRFSHLRCLKITPQAP